MVKMGTLARFQAGRSPYMCTRTSSRPCYFNRYTTQNSWPLQQYKSAISDLPRRLLGRYGDSFSTSGGTVGAVSLLNPLPLIT